MSAAKTKWMRRAAVVTGIAALTVAFVTWTERKRVRAMHRPTYLFDPLRVELRGKLPLWLRPEMARSIYASYQERSGAPFSLLDRERLKAWVGRIEGIDWVRKVDVRVRLPNEVDLDLDLRRPVAVVARRVPTLLALDGHELRQRWSTRPNPAARGADLPFGLPWVVSAPSAEALREAARLPARWHKALARVRGWAGAEVWLPKLVAIDARSHRDARRSAEAWEAEFELIVLAGRGHEVRLAWGHAPDSRFREISWEDKASVLKILLESHPKLDGIVSADLRYPDSWAARVRLRDARQH